MNWLEMVTTPPVDVPTSVVVMGLVRSCLVAMVALAVVSASMELALPERAWLLDDYADKVDALERDKDVFDVCAFGSSHVFRSFVPEVIESHLHARGMRLRFFNFGVPASFAYETDAAIRHFLGSHASRPRFVVIELRHWTPVLDAATDTVRGVAWHDVVEAPRVLRATWDRRSIRERMRLGFTHSRLTLARAFHVGMGPALASRLMSIRTPAEESRVDLLLRTQGFLPSGEQNDDGARPRREAFLESEGNWAETVHAMTPGDGSLPSRRSSTVGGVSLESFRAQVALLRRNGIEPVYVICATPDGQLNLDRLWDGPDAPAVLAFNRPDLYPELYALEMRFDGVHLNERGARLFSGLFADAFSEWLKAR